MTGTDTVSPADAVIYVIRGTYAHTKAIPSKDGHTYSFLASVPVFIAAVFAPVLLDLRNL